MLFDYNKFLQEKEFALYKRFILFNELQKEDCLSKKEYKFKFNPNFCIITEKEKTLFKDSFEEQTYNKFNITTSNNLQVKNFDYYIICNSFVSFAPNFLFEIVSELNRNRNIDFFYFDEDRIDDNKNRKAPFFKPDFSPDTLRSCNYIGNVICISKKIFDEIELLKNIKNKEDLNLYDIILRVSEKTKNICHIQKVLIHILKEEYKFDSERDKKAISNHLNRIGLKGIVKDGLVSETYKIEYEIKSNPLVSIIIPNHNHKQYLETCINSIRKKSTYKNYEIIIVENHSTEEDLFEYYKELEKDSKIKILTYTDEFNYASVNNFAVQKSNGDYLILLNNDIKIITSSWIEEMLMYAQRDDVGVVGAKLYYPNGTIQHAGITYGLRDSVEHIFRYFLRDSFGYGNRLSIVNNLSIVTGACIMSSRKKYLEVNGLDEQFKISFNDVDYCIKLRDKGYLVIFNPFIEAFHNEQITRGYINTKEKILLHQYERNLFFNKWRNYIEHYYNKNLTSNDYDFSIKGLQNGITKKIDNLISRCDILKNNLDLKDKEIQLIKNSWAYRIGRIFTYPFSIPLEFCKFILNYNLIKKSGLFDSEYYLSQNEDVKKAKINPLKHYLKFGWKEGRNPSAKFNGNEYLNKRPDVRVAGICPLVHYLKFGKEEINEYI